MEKTNTAQRVGREVRAQMVRAGIKRADVATSTGLSRTALDRRLSGEVPFRVDELQTIAKQLGVTPADLMSVEVPA